MSFGVGRQGADGDGQGLNLEPGQVELFPVAIFLHKVHEQ